MICEPAEWKHRVCLHGCVIHGPSCSGPLESHHVITQQALRKHGFEFALWDTRNGMALCASVHVRHTKAVERVTFDRLRMDTVEFADELGLGWMLDRYYPRSGDASVPGYADDAA